LILPDQEFLLVLSILELANTDSPHREPKRTISGRFQVRAAGGWYRHTIKIFDPLKVVLNEHITILVEVPKMRPELVQRRQEGRKV
jgi:hypothetical protein